MNKGTKKLFLSLALAMISSLAIAQQNTNRPNRSAFSNVGLGLEAGATGVGLEVATPLSKSFSLRAGFAITPITVNYTYDDFDPVNVQGYTVNVPDLDLKGKVKMSTGHLLVDWNPGQSVFFLTAGLYAGGDRLADVSGQFNMAEIKQELRQAGVPEAQVDAYVNQYISDIRVDVADASIAPNADGSVNAYLKVNSIRPYFGLGVGRAVPKHRVGFRFELGAMYIGKPDVDSPNIDGTLNSEELDGFNKTLSKCRFYPQLSFKLTYRLFKDK